MNGIRAWFARMFGWNTLSLSDEQKQRLVDWHTLPKVNLSASFENMRCIVLDVETSGLSLRKDRLISIGAVAVVNGRIALNDCYSIVLQQDSVSERENILLHEISGNAQREGMPAADALLSFLEFAGKDPLVAFHVMFDKTMIKKAIKRYLGFNFNQPWLDLAYVTPGLNPDFASSFNTLDDWSEKFHINNNSRHNALADALATAQLYLVTQAQGRRKNILSFEGLQYVEKLQHTLRQ